MIELEYIKQLNEKEQNPKFDMIVEFIEDTRYEIIYEIQKQLPPQVFSELINTRKYMGVFEVY